jgi:hypothetical protein
MGRHTLQQPLSPRIVGGILGLLERPEGLDKSYSRA